MAVPGRAKALIVRPDGIVMRAARDLTELIATLPHFHTTATPAGYGRDAIEVAGQEHHRRRA